MYEKKWYFKLKLKMCVEGVKLRKLVTQCLLSIHNYLPVEKLFTNKISDFILIHFFGIYVQSESESNPNAANALVVFATIGFDSCYSKEKGHLRKTVCLKTEKYSHLRFD